MANVPAELRYTASHEWVRVEGETATVGITDHAQHELTDVVFVELPPKGRVLKSGEGCTVVESVKTASDVYSPVSGEVVAINEALNSNPALVNSAPYGEGWLFQVRLTRPEELAELLDAAGYQSEIGES